MMADEQNSGDDTTEIVVTALRESGGGGGGGGIVITSGSSSFFNFDWGLLSYSSLLYAGVGGGVGGAGNGSADDLDPIVVTAPPAVPAVSCPPFINQLTSLFEAINTAALKNDALKSVWDAAFADGEITRNEELSIKGTAVVEYYAGRMGDATTAAENFAHFLQSNQALLDQCSANYHIQ